MSGWYKSTVCRGSYALGTACGKCEKCVEQKEQFAAKQSVNAALNTPSSALKEIRELKERVAELSLELDEARHHRHELASTWRDRAEKAEAKLAQAERERDEAQAALKPFAACADELDAETKDSGREFPDDEWAKFRLLVSDYRRARSALSPDSPTDTVRQAAEVLLGDDIALSKMAAAMHDGPLGADEYEFRADTKQGGWCLDMARAGLRALAARGGESNRLEDEPRENCNPTPSDSKAGA